jgi:poly(beta-D-mannuronate) lyase
MLHPRFKFAVPMFRHAKAPVLAGVLSCCAIANATACPFPPPPVHDIQLMRYGGATDAIKAEPAILDERAEDTSPVRDYLRIVVSEADVSYLQETESLGTYRAKCALEWLEVWARADALLGAAKSSEAIAERRGALSGAALAYIKVKSSANAEQAAAIAAWLSKLAVSAQFDLADSGTKTSSDHYWLGLALGATAVATSNDAMWQQARKIAEEAATSVSANGTLPVEPSHKSRALQDQAFTLMPLTALAELARARGEDFYALNDGALRALADTTLRGIDDPATFEAITGAVQDQPIDPQSGWMQLYALERPDTAANVRFELPSGHPWLGGNVLILHRTLIEPKANASSQDP